jgi:hypothetical protein
MQKIRCPLQAMNVSGGGGGGGVEQYILIHGTRWVTGLLHAFAALLPGKEPPVYAESDAE